MATINQIIALAVAGKPLPYHERPVPSGLNACGRPQS
jgi:hypothetical protein